MRILERRNMTRKEIVQQVKNDKLKYQQWKKQLERLPEEKRQELLKKNRENNKQQKKKYKYILKSLSRKERNRLIKDQNYYRKVWFYPYYLIAWVLFLIALVLFYITYGDEFIQYITENWSKIVEENNIVKRVSDWFRELF